MLARITAVF